MDLMEILESQKERVRNMASDTTLCICPNCKSKVYPKFVYYFTIGRSGLYWCPVCFKGEAGCRWRETEL